MQQASNERDDMFTMFRWSTSCLPTPATQKNPIETVMSAADELKSVVRTATSLSPRTTENGGRRESTDHAAGTNRSNDDLLKIVDAGDKQQATGRRCLSRKSPPFEDDDMFTMFHWNRQMSFDDDDMFTMFHWANSPEEELFGGRQIPIRQLLREHGRQRPIRQLLRARNDGPTARAA